MINSSEEEDFWNALEKGKLDQMRQVLETRRDLVDATLPSPNRAYSWTPMHIAAQKGCSEIIEELVKAGSRAIDQSTEREWPENYTPMLLAAKHGHANVIETLVRLGSRAIDTANAERKITPMHLAAYYGHSLVIETLFRLGSQSLDAEDAQGVRPIGYAARNEQPAVVELLVRLGSTGLDSPDIEGNTPMHLAATNGSIGVIEKLLQLGSRAIDQFSTRRATSSLVCNLLDEDAPGTPGGFEEEEEEDVDDDEGGGSYTPLGLAASNEQPAAIVALVRLGSRAIDLPDTIGLTPLHLAAGNGDPKSIEVLVQLGSQSIDAVDNDGETPLHLTKQFAFDIQTIKTLIQCGSRAISTRNHNGDTLLQLALQELPEDLDLVANCRFILALSDSPLAAVPAALQEHALFDEEVVHDLRHQVYFAESLLARLLFDLGPPTPPAAFSPVQPDSTIDFEECIRSAFRISSSADVELVMEQVQCTREEAESALREHNGSIIDAILMLSGIE